MNRLTSCPAWRSIIAAALILTTGCQQYQRKPVDLIAHRAAFLARTPEAPEVAAFAMKLEEAGRAVAGGFDLRDGVSLAEAEAVAMVFNADLRFARLKAGVTRAGADHAGRWEDPTLGVDLTRIVESVDHPWKTAGVVGLTIPLSGRLAAERQRAGAEHITELARVVEREWRVRMELRRVWAKWSALGAETATMREFLARVELVLGVVDAMERAGELARTEARLFRIEKATRQAEVKVLEAQAAGAELAIKQIMGLAPSAPVKFAESDRGDSGATFDATEVRNRALIDNPGIAVAKARYEVAERNLHLEIRKQYPDLQIGAGLGSDEGLDEVLLGLSIPIPILNGNRRAIAEAQAAREAARTELEGTLETLLSDLSGAEVAWKAAVEQRRLLEEEIVPLVDAQYSDARRAAELGEVNTLVMLESLARQQDAKVKLIGARQTVVMAAVRVEELAGPRATGVKP